MKWLVVVVLTIVASVAGAPRDAWAWGDQGHKIICEIAVRLVQPNTRAEIQKLMSNDERFTSFSESCTWPDHPRQRASEHFLNLPRDSDGLHSETCPGASTCVVTAIKKDFEVLSSNSASQAQKLASLKFIGHWVGDIHQPLHVSFEDDRGGNNVMVTGECGPNLHSAWDMGLLPSRSLAELQPEEVARRFWASGFHKSTRYQPSRQNGSRREIVFRWI